MTSAAPRRTTRPDTAPGRGRTLKLGLPKERRQSYAQGRSSAWCWCASCEDKGRSAYGLSVLFADPAPLGLAAFALTTVLLSVTNAGLMKNASGLAFRGYAFAYGGLVQLLAGMWEFRNGNVFGATAFGSYGGFWIGILTEIVLFIGGFDGNANISKVGGYIGILTAVVAWYASAGLLACWPPA
ncbi:MAG: acetate uptake transporter [Streptosporangiaceae bacterium]